MKTIKSIFVVFVAFGYLSCNPTIPRCAITSNELLESNKDRIFSTHETLGIADEFRDKGNDSIRGGYYSFYKNNIMKSYYYFIDMEKYIYVEQFDSLGMLMYEDGNPLVHKSGELIADSLIVKFYFFMLKKKYRKIDLKISKSQTVPLHLSEDTLFSNVQSAKYVYHGLNSERNIAAYLDVEYQNECTGQIKVFRDSINLHYSPDKK